MCLRLCVRVDGQVSKRFGILYQLPEMGTMSNQFMVLLFFFLSFSLRILQTHAHRTAFGCICTMRACVSV